MSCLQRNTTNGRRLYMEVQVTPQVLYEIFRAIEMEENNGKHGI